MMQMYEVCKVTGVFPFLYHYRLLEFRQEGLVFYQLWVHTDDWIQADGTVSYEPRPMRVDILQSTKRLDALSEFVNFIHDHEIWLENQYYPGDEDHW